MISALALAGAVTLALSFAFPGRLEPRAAGTDAPVNRSARAPSSLAAHNSPTLVENPRRPAQLVVVNRVDAPRYGCAMHVSDDRGRSWSPVVLPVPAGRCYAPDAAFSSDGVLHVSFVSLRGRGNRPHAVWTVSSADGGRSLSAPVRVGGPLAFQVRIAADPDRPERLYLTWLQATDVGIFLFAGTGNRIVAARSRDRGRTWSPPQPASDPRRVRVLAPAPAVGPDGGLDVLYLDVGEDRLDYEGGHGGSGGPPYGGRFTLVLGRSRDGGATWAESVVDDGIVPTRRFVPFLPPLPSIAIDQRSGRVHAGFEDGGAAHVWTLEDDAWRGPVRVGGDARLPRLAVAPDGRLDVAYYDRDGTAAAVLLQSSDDGGRTFSPATTLTSRRFDVRVGPGSERGLPDLGNRLGLVAGARRALVAWADTRSGTPDSGKQDVAFAVAELERAGGLDPAARWTLRAGGALLLSAALALVLRRTRTTR